VRKTLIIIALSLVSVFSLLRIVEAALDYQIASLELEMNAAIKAPVPHRPIQPVPLPRVSPPVVQHSPTVCDDQCKMREVVFI
jgi:hypothetical protein